MGNRAEDRAVRDGKPGKAAEEIARPAWNVPWHAKVPGAALAAIMAAAWLWSVLDRGLDGMAPWGLSAAGLRSGDYGALIRSMFAHAGVLHLLMNTTVLYGISEPLVARMGDWPGSWVRYFALFFLSGFAAEVTYLALHPFGTVPMVGASGAIYGLLGALLRLEPESGRLRRVRSGAIGKALWSLVKENALLFALLALPALLSGRGGGLAWEAHLGGIAFGLLLGPRFLVFGAPEDRAMSSGGFAPPAISSAGSPDPESAG